MFQESNILAIQDPTILVSTLNGTLLAVSMKTGAVKWTLHEGNFIHIVEINFRLHLNFYFHFLF